MASMRDWAWGVSIFMPVGRIAMGLVGVWGRFSAMVDARNEQPSSTMQLGGMRR
jgi:hypothetical protein